ncbi:hypothetical protein KM043_014259 [Ampulex compressa]|nr:hypothetical protein KM043_014259 [Ampulex compressa]
MKYREERIEGKEAHQNRFSQQGLHGRRHNGPKTGGYHRQAYFHRQNREIIEQTRELRRSEDASVFEHSAKDTPLEIIPPVNKNILHAQLSAVLRIHALDDCLKYSVLMEDKGKMPKVLHDKCRRLKKFYIGCRILLWKAVLMRMDSPITTILEIVVPIVFSLQIRLMFEPLALNIQNLDRYTKDDILSKFSTEAQCWYVPKDAFIDDLMSRVSKKLRTKILPAETESNLVKSYFSKNKTSKALWAIFDIDSNVSSRPKVLKYKIRSSEIGESSMIMLHEEEPVAKDPYISSGFIALQMAIERSFIEMWENPTFPRIGYDLNMGRYPYYKVDFLIMPSMVRPSISVIYYMIVVAFILLPIATLQKIMHDKETGFRNRQIDLTGCGEIKSEKLNRSNFFQELMRLMNMPFAILYIGWFNHLMITGLPITIVCTILLSPVFSNAYAVVAAMFILLYIVLSALFMFALGTFFRNSTKALLTSILFWLFLTHFTIVLDQSLARASLTWRIASLILPHSGLLYGLVSFTSRMDLEIQQSEAAKHLIRESGHGQVASHLWPKKISELLMLRDVHEIVHATEKISIGIILTAWSFHILLWYTLTIYLDNINPGQFKSAKPWYYLCKKTTRDTNVELTFRGSTNWSAVEKTPSYIKPSVRVRCVTKKFGRMGERVIGVKDMTIAFYKQEFSVILGHNGAGKSCLLKIIIDILVPTDMYLILK